ncbi:MAG: hypothetical protein JWL66_1778, partial [Sphingomonadales bacterium]|nr:hypothetical protein [Sphingomonadales bacterium]
PREQNVLCRADGPGLPRKREGSPAKGKRCELTTIHESNIVYFG